MHVINTVHNEGEMAYFGRGRAYAKTIQMRSYLRQSAAKPSLVAASVSTSSCRIMVVATCGSHFLLGLDSVLSVILSRSMVVNLLLMSAREICVADLSVPFLSVA